MPAPLDTAALRARLHAVLAARGVVRSRELQAALGVSQATISRLIADDGRIARVGAGRSARYGLRVEVAVGGAGDLGVELPLFRIDEAGLAHRVGLLERLASDQIVVRDPAGAALDVADDLPWFLQDLRPAGFLGRLLPRRHPELGAPSDIRLWSASDVLRYLNRFGADLPGDLVVGEAALQHALGDRGEVVDGADSGAAYDRIADDVLHHGAAGSSAAGEQPKFLARRRLGGGERAVLVKFRPLGGGAVDQRWVDLCVSEHLALETLRSEGVAAAASRLVFTDRRVHLEVERFDRTPDLGRLPTVSLAVLDGAFVGVGRDPVAVAEALVRSGRAPAGLLDDLRVLHTFGGLIGNSDMHLGNFTAWRIAELAPKVQATTGLAPAYDMLPMVLAPRGGEVLDAGFSPPSPRPVQGFRQAWSMARSFWGRVSDEPRISELFREIARHAAEALAAQADVVRRLPDG